jgi:hypothetical protein
MFAVGDVIRSVVEDCAVWIEGHARVRVGDERTADDAVKLLPFSFVFPG